MTDIEIIKERISDWLKKDCAEPLYAQSGQYTIEEAAKNTYEIEINRFYFISVGKLAEDTYEVFTLHYSTKTKTSHKNWDNIPADDDHLCQHKCFSSWERAFNYALRYAKKQETPKNINEIW